ncbi:hypothetical protein Patl1_33344 [Pistacia atlantica]|uniref:Uncharacterized protein n=1 Tax=Pistacia atlantica TaxID=434234 RepID=A0ACC0ZU24_9ROSI|nr:hypothetical protein Patl1_33344 [Pistacia atlantica]
MRVALPNVSELQWKLCCLSTARAVNFDKYAYPIKNDWIYTIYKQLNSQGNFYRRQVKWNALLPQTQAKGETILQCLRDFDLWRTHLEDKDFVTTLNHHLNQLQRQTIHI